MKESNKIKNHLNDGTNSTFTNRIQILCHSKKKEKKETETKNFFRGGGEPASCSQTASRQRDRDVWAEVGRMTNTLGTFLTLLYLLFTKWMSR